jgi:5-methylthioadenosine/S-adenosylhomocysteine deaminase
MDQKFSLYEPGGVAVKAGRIVAVGPSAEIADRFSSRSVFNAAGRIVMPGLVNTHTQDAMTLLRSLADDLP